MSRHLPSGHPPTENTLVINISHEMLLEIQTEFPYAIAVSPTRISEGREYGYDVAMDWNWAKILVLQFKRPLAKLGTIQNKKGTDGHFKFEINSSQLADLQDDFNKGEAFLTFPMVQSRQEMPWNLGETVFVDVHGVSSDEVSRAYIHQDANTPNDFLGFVNSKSYGIKWVYFNKDPSEDDATITGFGLDDGTYRPNVFIKTTDNIVRIDPTYVFTWDTLWSHLLQCKIGKLLMANGERQYFQEEYQTHNPSGERVFIFGGDGLPEGVEWEPTF